MATKKPKNGMSVKTYRGDAKTLLAFNLPKAKTKNLAGFTILVKPKGKTPFFLHNQLRFEDPSKHAQDAKLPANSSFNAPIHKFRWLHIPGSLQQGTHPFLGEYEYTVTPRYFDGQGSLLPIDNSLGTTVKVMVKPFVNGNIELGFTRGFVQSQAFVHHFGPKAIFRPKNKELLFDTSQVAGKSPLGQDYTFDQEYEWLGFTARDKIFALANEVLTNKQLRLDVFAYDLNEPDLMTILLKLAKQGRIRMILDNASLHHNTQNPEPEDQFETEFNKVAKAPAQIKRGKFGRFAHDKVFVISKGEDAVKVLTGSTNFSVTGLYVNSNHVVVFNDADISKTYADVFNLAWNTDVKANAFANSDEAKEIFSFSKTVPTTEITFSPHLEEPAKLNLDNLVKRLTQEQTQANGSILFAVMGLDQGTGPVLPELRKLHADDKIFTYGISDSPGGIFVYTPHSKHGALVSGKPNATKLPPPFDQVPQLGLGHQIHHKFVVCGFNGKKPVVYCGSSNLALGGEEENGDNLIAMHDPAIATVFALEALALVDHFDFLDRSAVKAGKPAVNVKQASKQDQAAGAGWFLSTTDNWVKKYYDPNDLRFLDRTLFG